MNDLYSTDVRVICEFADGSEHKFVLSNFARRTPAGHVTWDRSHAGVVARSMVIRLGLGEPVAMRMSLVKGA